MSIHLPGPFTDPKSLSYLHAVAQMSGARWHEKSLVQINTGVAFDLLSITLSGTGSIADRCGAAGLVQMRRTAHLCSSSAEDRKTLLVKDRIDPLDPLRLRQGLIFTPLIDEAQAQQLRQLAGADVLRMSKQVGITNRPQRGMLLMLLKRLMD